MNVLKPEIICATEKLVPEIYLGCALTVDEEEWVYNVYDIKIREETFGKLCLFSYCLGIYSLSSRTHVCIFHSMRIYEISYSFVHILVLYFLLLLLYDFPAITNAIIALIALARIYLSELMSSKSISAMASSKTVFYAITSKLLSLFTIIT